MPSHLYTTKALGRAWLPPPIKRGLHDDSTTNMWKLFPNHARENMSSWREKMPDYVAMKWSNMSSGGTRKKKRLRWSRIHERVALSILLVVGVLWYLIGSGGRGGDGSGSSMLGLLLSRTHAMEKDNTLIQEEMQLRMHNATWSDFAYVTLATDLNGLCNAFMLVESLHRLGAKAGRVILYPEHRDLLSPSSRQWGMLDQARVKYGAQLRKMDIQQKVHHSAGDATKRKEQGERDVAILEGFNLTEFKRVLVLDAQSTLLRSMDELFLLEEGMVVNVAAPRAYWMNEGSGGPYAMAELNEAVALIRPSEEGWEKVKGEMKRKRKTGSKRGVASRVFGKEAMMLSHKPYTLLSREFREDGHDAYLGGEGVWDPVRALAEAKFVLFGGETVRPWERQDGRREQVRPQCKTMVNGADVRQDCGDRDVWDWLYADFAERRMRVCAMGPAE